MPKFIKKRGIILSIAAVIVLAALYYVLFLSQIFLTDSSYSKDLTSKLDSTEKALSESMELLEESYESYDKISWSKVKMAAYYAKNDDSILLGRRSMNKLLTILDVDNVIVIDSKGNYITSANPVDIDFTAPVFDPLRETFETHEPTEGLYLTDTEAEESYIYNAMYVSDDAEILIVQNSKELDELNRNSSSWENILSRNTYGLNGINFSIGTDYKFLYFPDDKIFEKSPSYIGISQKDLQSDNQFVCNVNGIEYMCKSRYIEAEEAYVVCGIDINNVLRNISISVIIILFIIGSCIFLQILYAMMIMREEYEEHDKIISVRGFLAQKMWGLFLLCMCLILIFSYFIQTLFTLSIQLLASRQEISHLETILSENTLDNFRVSDDYDKRLTRIAMIAADFINNNPSKINKTSLKEMKEALNVEHILIYDSSGTVTLSDSSYKGLTLSRDPDNSSYNFRRLLGGIPFYLGGLDPEYLENPYVYVGATLVDENGDVSGLVQLACEPETYYSALYITQDSNILSTFNGTNDSFAFTVNKETLNFDYYPEESYLGKPAVDYGLEEIELRDGYSGYITIDNEKYYSECRECENYYLFVAAPMYRLHSLCFKRILVTALIAMVSFLIFCTAIILSSGNINSHLPEVPETSGKKKTFIGRGMDKLIENSSAEERIEKYIFFIYMIICISVTVLMALKGHTYDEASIMSYLLNQKWDKGTNIFAVIYCFFIICRTSIITVVISAILKIMGNTFDQRGETVCRMLRSFVSYIAVLGTIFICLGKLGVQTGTLLASAGILTAVIGFGAQKLIADVLEGLFIVFEGIFQVGDMVKVDGYRGIIKEIGIRTTTIFDLDHNNTRIYNNTQLVSVENLSKDISFCDVVIGTEYGDSIEKLEAVFDTELPLIKEKIATLVEGPFYMGVDTFENSSVNLRFRLYCNEEDMTPTRRAFNREIKLMFDRYGINVPFPQIVLNQRY
ncbi:MAG: mechanosensitive ion channel family protein [Lachnospiraceae bacterium]|nr:mechanosensitive ion channel family protein [Lachnospiraceae bacterium]